MEPPQEEPPQEEPRAVVCIGDIHGPITKLTNLWSNLCAALPRHLFSTALVIFLGDYCDRGPSTRHVIDFLSSLPSLYPHQTHVFLSGNHDLAFSAFIGVLPRPVGGYDFSQGWREFEENKEREVWYDGEGYGEMHVQGRLWAGKIVDRENLAKETVSLGSIYDARPTFESYGVEHGSAGTYGNRLLLTNLKAVPEEHKKFPADLVWVHEEDEVSIETPDGIKHCRLIAVHAGLEKGKDVAEQLRILKARDTRVPTIAALSGRKNVWDIPKELTEPPTIVVSGHHGKLHIEGLWLIIDEGRGLEQNTIAAVVLPSLKIIRDADVIPSQNPDLL